MAEGVSGKAKILIDSGASRHMIPNLEWFQPETYQILQPPKKIRFGDESFADAVGYGTVCFLSKVEGHTYEIVLRWVLHVPSFTVSLISVPRLGHSGIDVSFTGKLATLSKRDTILGYAHRENNLY